MFAIYVLIASHHQNYELFSAIQDIILTFFVPNTEPVIGSTAKTHLQYSTL